MRRFKLPTLPSFGISSPSGNAKCNESTHQPIFKSGGKIIRDLAAHSNNDTTDMDEDDRFADVSSAYGTSDYSEHETLFKNSEPRTLFTDGITLRSVERSSTDDMDMKLSGSTDDDNDAEVILTSARYSVDTIQEVESRAVSSGGEFFVNEQDSFDFEVLGNQVVSIVAEEPGTKAPTIITQSACSARDKYGGGNSLRMNEDIEINPLRLSTDSMLSENSDNRVSEESVSAKRNESDNIIPSLANVRKMAGSPSNTAAALKPLLASVGAERETNFSAKVVRAVHISGRSICYAGMKLGATILVVLLISFDCIRVIARWTIAAISRGTSPEETPSQIHEKNVCTQVVRNTCTHGNRGAVTDNPASKAITDHYGSSTFKGINSSGDDCGIFPLRTGSGKLSLRTGYPGRTGNWSGRECPLSLETIPRAGERLKMVQVGSMERGSSSSVSIGTNETVMGTSEVYSDARKVLCHKTQISEPTRPPHSSTLETSTNHLPREFDPSAMKVEYEQSELVLSPLKITKPNALERKVSVTAPAIAQSTILQDEKVQSTNDTKAPLKKRPTLAAGLRQKVARSNIHPSNSKTIDELKAMKDSVLRVFSINKNYHEVRFESRKPAQKTLILLADLLVKEYECTVAVKKNGGLKIRFERSFDKGRKLRVRATFHPTSQFSCTVAVCRSREDDLTVSWRECDAFVKSFQSSLQS